MGSSSPRAAGAPPQPRQTLLTLILTIILFGTVAYLSLYPPNKLLRRVRRVFYAFLGRIPLPSTIALPSDLAIAITSYRTYSHAQQKSIDAKWRSFERLKKSHRRLGERLGWRRTLEEVETKTDINSALTDELATLGMEEARRTGTPLSFRSRFWRQDGRVVEVLKHFVRDWSVEGAREREVLFPPILDALKKEFPVRDGFEPLKVLVPGCGLARLAYEIALLGFETEANDFSHFMSIGSHLIFRATHEPNQHLVHPFIHSFSHHRSTGKMLRGITFPDVVPSRETPLTFKQGDFLSLFPGKETHDAVVTLFFIDTASNLVDYLETIWRVLKPGGIWINEGPLLYYGTPGMALCCDDVVRLAELVGFVVEKRSTIKKAEYTADPEGMYTFAYDCETWIARKPVILTLPAK